MQVVFVHGVNTRNLGDGDYDRWVAGRSDRLRRLAFGGKADIRNPYWGKFGLADKKLRALPAESAYFAPMAVGAKAMADEEYSVVGAARQDFEEVIAALSATAIADATEKASDRDRHMIEDFWMAAAEYAEANSRPGWLSDVSSTAEFTRRLKTEVEVAEPARLPPLGNFPPPGKNIAGARRLGWPPFDGNAFAANKAREIMSGYLAQFLGDALMFFSRREKSSEVRRTIAAEIVAAACDARAKAEPLVLIGYSMGGGVLHELLTDPQEVSLMETQIGAALKIDLFLSVGTQIGLFSELQQFAVPSGNNLLGVTVTHYWNVFDYNDTLAFLCAPVLPGSIDLEINTSAGVVNAHGAYFDSALFFRRLRAKLIDAGLTSPK